MTNEELFNDLKQLIEATVSQQVAGLATREDVQVLNRRIDNLEQRMATKDDLTAVEQRMATKDGLRTLESRFDDLDIKLNTIQDAIGESFERTELTLKDHERRIHRLERRAA